MSQEPKISFQEKHFWLVILKDICFEDRQHGSVKMLARKIGLNWRKTG